MTSALHAHGDIWIGDLALNAKDELGGHWVVENVEGWWTTPEPDIPEDPRPFNEDGNYWTSGRYGPRDIEIEGVYLPAIAKSEKESQENIQAARAKLISQLDMVRKTGVLTFYEVDQPKQIEVQSRGVPLIETRGTSNLLRFNVAFTAADPRKYSIGTKNFIGHLRQYDSGGREYNLKHPRRYADTGNSNRLIVYNSGDVATNPQIRITGPVSNPLVRHMGTGQFIKVNIDLGVSDFLDIDTLKKTIILNEQISKAASLDFASEWFIIAPGVTEMSFEGAQTQPAQEGWSAAVNLITNPSMQNSNGAVTVIDKNLLPDPSFNRGSTTQTVIRTNLATIPSLAPDSSTPGEWDEEDGWVVLPTYTYTTITASPDAEIDGEVSGGNVVLSITPTLDSTDSYADVTQRTGLAAGGTYTIAADVETAGTWTGPRSQFARGAVLSYDVNGTSQTRYSSLPADQVSGRVSFTADIPTGAVNISLRLYNGSQVNSSDEDGTVVEDASSVYWSNLVVVPGGGRDSFFDGDSEIRGDVTYDWTPEGYSQEIAPSTANWTPDENTVSYLEDGTLILEYMQMGLISSNEFSVPFGETTVGLIIEASTDSTVTLSMGVEDNLSPSVSLNLRAGSITPLKSVLFNPEDDGDARLIISASRNDADSLTPTSVRIRSAMVVSGNYRGEYFDGDTPPAGMASRWVGDVSESFAHLAPGYVPGPASHAHRTPSWTSTGVSGLALYRKSDSDPLEENYVEIASPAWSSLPNGLYTLYATVFAEHGEYSSDNPSVLLEAVDSGSGMVFRSSPAQKGQMTNLVLKFVKETNTGQIRVVSGALDGAKTFVDAVLLVAGEYTDRYFDGGSPEASWIGTPNNSRSSQTYKEDIPSATAYIEFSDTWIR